MFSWWVVLIFLISCVDCDIVVSLLLTWRYNALHTGQSVWYLLMNLTVLRNISQCLTYICFLLYKLQVFHGNDPFLCFPWCDAFKKKGQNTYICITKIETWNVNYNIKTHYMQIVLIYTLKHWYIFFLYLVTISQKQFKGSSSYCSWIYNYLCNQCISPLTLYVQILFMWGVLDTTLCDKVCQWLAASRWCSGFLHV